MEGKKEGNRDRVIKLMKDTPMQDSWTPTQISQALGIPYETVRKTINHLKARGEIVLADIKERAQYKLSAASMKQEERDPRIPRRIITAPPSKGGPCPQSDGILRTMRASGGERTARQWASLAIERDSVTAEMLEKLVKHRLAIKRGDLYRVAR